MKDKILIVGGDTWYALPFYDLPNAQDYEVTSKMRYLEEKPEEIALVLFTGGEDVHPVFYSGIDSSHVCYTNAQRDFYEIKVFRYCNKKNIKMTGICRGFQLLNVLSGGRMYQHIRFHNSLPHLAHFLWKDKAYVVTSSHHQLVLLPPDGIPTIWSKYRRSDIYVGPEGEMAETPEKEIEAAIFPSTKSMGVQFHPEMMAVDRPGRIEYINMISDYIQLEFEAFQKKYTEVSHANESTSGESGGLERASTEGQAE